LCLHSVRWFGWRTLVCILYGGLGLDGRFGIRFGRGRQMARVGVLGVVLGVMICASTRWILRCEICFRCVETVALDEMQRRDGAGARVGFVRVGFVVASG
jgi:hypothetical protein